MTTTISAGKWSRNPITEITNNGSRKTTSAEQHANGDWH